MQHYAPIQVFEPRSYQRWAEAMFARYHAYVSSMEIVTSFVEDSEGNVIAIVPELKVTMKTTEEVVSEVFEDPGFVPASRTTVIKTDKNKDQPH